MFWYSIGLNSSYIEIGAESILRNRRIDYERSIRHVVL